VKKKHVAELYRTAFVTGAGSGLGRAFAEMLMTEGVRVWGSSRALGRLADLAAAFPRLFQPVALDLADGAAAEAAFLRAAEEAGGAFDLVINNAGYGLFGEFGATPCAAWQAQLDAMLGATLRLTHAAYRAMGTRQGGCLVNVSSIAAEFPLPFMAGYNIAKAGLSALSESLIFETRGTPIKVVDFRPGDYRTDFNNAMRSVSPSLSSPRLQAAERVLEAHLRAGPPPARAAADLRRALLGGRTGIVRSGSFFQATAAPFLARLAPSAVVRAVHARYFR
jgi:short-subunit dehydrogenase